MMANEAAYFFFKSKTVLIKLVSPQAAQLGIHFWEENLLHLLQGPLKGHISVDGKS